MNGPPDLPLVRDLHEVERALQQETTDDLVLRRKTILAALRQDPTWRAWETAMREEIHRRTEKILDP